MVFTTPEGVVLLQASVSNYIFVASVAIICYDHALTIRNEIRLIWRRPLRFLSVAFLLIRYFALFLSIVRSILLFHTLVSPKVCHVINLIRDVFLAMVASYVKGLQLWRVSALYSHDKNFLSKAITPLIIIIVFSLCGMRFNPGMPDEYVNGCPHSKAEISSDYYKLIWIMLSLWEAVMIMLTINKTWEAVSVACGPYRGRFLRMIVLRDSVSYFLILVGSNLLNIATFFIDSPVLAQSAFFWMEACVAVIVASRIVLNLRESSYAKIVVYSAQAHGTADIVMSDLIDQQLRALDEEP